MTGGLTASPLSTSTDFKAVLALGWERHLFRGYFQFVLVPASKKGSL